MKLGLGGFSLAHIHTVRIGGSLFCNNSASADKGPNPMSMSIFYADKGPNLMSMSIFYADKGPNLMSMSISYRYIVLMIHGYHFPGLRLR
jgi:hypothetical protein